MATLTAARRRKLKASQFASPKGRGPDRSRNQYPIHDRRHAANAKARATQMRKRGKLSASAAARIHAKANRVLKRTAPKGRTRRKTTARRRRR